MTLRTRILFISLAITLTGCRQNDASFIAFADTLLNAKITSKENHEKLLKDIKAGAIIDGFQFVAYCDKAVIIKEANYPSEPEKYLELMHRDVSRLLPELSFRDFRVQVRFDSTISDKESKFYDFVVSIACNGKTYHQISSYRLYSPGQNRYYGNKIDQQEFYKIFNKVLADHQSVYRLHEVKSTPGNAVDWTQFGIIALTLEQAKTLHGGGNYFTPSYESFKNTLTSGKIDTIISEFQKTGLFSHLSDDQIKNAREKVKQQENNHVNDVLACFPRTVYYFDTELANLEDPYKEILNELSIISHGLFKPSEISDSFSKPENGKSTIRFSVNGRQYTKTLRVEDDWIDPEFFDVIKQVTSDNKIGGWFYELYAGGQEACLVFLSTEQYHYLRKNKLLVFADQWESVEE